MVHVGIFLASTKLSPHKTAPLKSNTKTSTKLSHFQATLRFASHKLWPSTLESCPAVCFCRNTPKSIPFSNLSVLLNPFFLCQRSFLEVAFLHAVSDCHTLRHYFHVCFLHCGCPICEFLNISMLVTYSV